MKAVTSVPPITG